MLNPNSRPPETPGLKRKVVRDFLQTAQTLGKRGVLYNDYDEPTYVGFAVVFDFWSQSTLVSGNYDYFPEGLLYSANAPYSAENYLRSIDEHQRADMIKGFRSLLYDLSSSAQHYIQSVSGLDTLYKLNPEDNFRGKEAKVTLKLLEGIDMRTSAMLDLYRRAAFDSTWMRWALPDTHRYFSMSIYVTEFRSFHVPRGKDKERMTDGDKTAMGTRTTDPFPAGEYEGSKGKDLKSVVQGYKDQAQNMADSVAGAFQDGGALTPAGIKNQLSPGSFFTGDQGGGPNGKHFIKALDRNLSIIEYKLSQCEISLADMAPGHGAEISNADTGEAISNEVIIKVGKIREVNEYSVLGAALNSKIESEFNAIKEGVFSDLNIDQNWTSEDKRTVTKASNDLYNYIIGDYSSANKDAAYTSMDAGSPYTSGHLGETKDIKSKSLGENLLEKGLEQATGAIENAIKTFAQGLLLGNVYGLSASTLANRISADPRAVGDALVDLIKKTNTPDNANAILNNIYDNLPATSSRFDGDPGSAGLTGANALYLNPTNAGLTGADALDLNPTNAGLTGAGVNPPSGGNIGLVGSPSSIDGNPGSAGLTGSDSNTGGNPGSAGLTGGNSDTSGNPGGIGLTGGNSNTNGNPGSAGLTGGNSNTSGNPGGIGLTGGNSNTNGNPGDVGLTGSNTSINGNPGDVGLTGGNSNINGSGGNVGLTGGNSDINGPSGNVGLSGSNSSIDGNPGGIGLDGVITSIDGNPGDIGLDGVITTIDGNLGSIGLDGAQSSTEGSGENIGLSGSNSTTDGSNQNIGLQGPEPVKEDPGNIGLSGNDSTTEGSNENIGLTGSQTTEPELGNIGLDGAKPEVKNPGNIGLKGVEPVSADLGNIGLVGNESSLIPQENIGLSGAEKKNSSDKQITLSGAETKESKPVNVGLSGDFLRKQALGKIELTGGKSDTKGGLGNINLTGPDSNINGSLGNANLTGSNPPQNDLGNAGLTGQSNNAYPSEGTNLQTSNDDQLGDNPNE